jgi:hypothetical protein
MQDAFVVLVVEVLKYMYDKCFHNNTRYKYLALYIESRTIFLV